MPIRALPFIDGGYYHIFNRGVEKRKIFGTSKDYQRFLNVIAYYQLAGPKPRFSYFVGNRGPKIEADNQIVEIIAYCLMPNHFHILARQLQEGGISEFAGKLSNSYTKYYNTKYKRIGPLFQGEFKSVLVESDEQLLHLSRYIHLNPIASFLVKDLIGYEWSSYSEYIHEEIGLCSKSEVLSFFKGGSDYQKFVLDQTDYAQSLEIIKHQLLEV